MKRSRKYDRVAIALIGNPNEKHWASTLRSDVGIRYGALYPILWRMVEEGHLEDGWTSEPPDSPKATPRRFYTLTDLGKKEFASAAPQRIRKPLRSVKFRPAIG